MVMFYCSAQPSNIKPFYGAYDQVDWVIKPAMGRSVMSNSFRISGNIAVTKLLYGQTASVPVTPADQVFLDPFAGIHGIVKNVSSLVNERIIENESSYARYVSQKTQATNTLESLTSSSASIPELKGLLNNVSLALSTGAGGCPFSFKPMVALNRSNTDLPVSKFNQMKILMTLASSLECLYCSLPEPALNAVDHITALTFTISNLQLNWYEIPEVSIPRTVFKTTYLTTQSIVSLNTNLYVTAPTIFDTVSCSFILQGDRNKVYKNDLLCNYIPSITRLEFTINGLDSPLVYAIGGGASPPYQDIALNYAKSLEYDPEKNCVLNKLLSESVAFGIGVAFHAQQNSKLGIAITLDQNTDFNPSVGGNGLDSFIYTNGYLEV